RFVSPGGFESESAKCSYFFLRLTRPATNEPKPSSPSKGSGEAVCGSFWPAFASAEVGFWSATVAFLSAEGALWSAAVALLAEGAFWSFPMVLLAGGFCAVVLDA